MNLVEEFEKTVVLIAIFGSECAQRYGKGWRDQLTQPEQDCLDVMRDTRESLRERLARDTELVERAVALLREPPKLAIVN